MMVRDVDGAISDTSRRRAPCASGSLNCKPARMAEPAFFERAAGLAHLLRGSARPGRPIVAVTASAEALATAACAAFALDAPIFPLDPHLPEPIAKNLLDQIGECLVIGEGRGVSTEAILAAEPAAALKFSPPRGPALLIATSGSSGRPKAVVLTGAALAASAAASAKITSLRAGDRWLACLPLFHIGGFSILIRCALAGAEAMLHRGFDAERVHGALVEGRITHVSLTPTMLAQLLALQKPAPTGLRHAPRRRRGLAHRTGASRRRSAAGRSSRPTG